MYKQETSACNPTCANPDAPEQCNLPDTENCVCKNSLDIFHQGKCVAAATCGCRDEHGVKYDVRCQPPLFSQLNKQHVHDMKCIQYPVMAGMLFLLKRCSQNWGL